MAVEDHPLEYGEFEGVIPEGYGAGIVMLWDRGTWTPEVADVDAALRKGDLKFTLNGYKLKGSWVLVRTSGRFAGARSAGDGRSWLLIKHRDEWSGDLDIASFAPRSVKSNGDFEDILAADTPDLWTTNKPAKGGETGAELAAIIERAARLKARTSVLSASVDVSAPGRRRSTTSRTKAAEPAVKKKRANERPGASRKSSRSST